LHDIGKIAVPDAVLNKAGQLTNLEYELMKQHPAEGARMLENLQALAEIIPLVRWHHERPDGKGYPDGLRGNEIPLVVRILSVADVFDALHSERPYRPAIAEAECLKILHKTAREGGLDPELVQCFAETF